MSDDWVEREARALEDFNRATREKLEGRTANQHIRNRWVAETLAVEDAIITSQPAEVYRLPLDTAKFLKPGLISELSSILAIVREINDELAGMRVSQGQVVLHGDERVIGVERRLRAWADEYAASRLAKPNVRDQGDPMLKFRRLYGELVPRLEAIAYRDATIHRSFFTEFTDYVPWVLYQKTWAPLVEFHRPPGTLTSMYRVLMLNPVARQYAQEMMQLYGWTREDDVEIVLREVAAELPPNPAPVDEEDVRTRLQVLALDIEEMRPFLIRNFKSEKVIVQIADRVFASWAWVFGRGVGMVPFASSREEMLTQHHLSSYAATLLVGYDGALTGDTVSWIDIWAYRERPGYVHAALTIVEKIHAALLALYQRVDVHAILAQWRERRAKVESAAPSDEEVAASCLTIAEPHDVTQQDGAPVPRAVPIRSVRSQRLFAILTDRLGCEVRQGKGSEIVVYRPGGHHFRLGHHKRNEYVPSFLIKNLLDHVGISFEEWLAALT